MSTASSTSGASGAAPSTTISSTSSVVTTSSPPTTVSSTVVPTSSSDSPSTTVVSSQPGNNNGGNNMFGTSSTLYLYTFLATLVLLLGVSLCIVLRSLVMRRRHRRMVEEAIRNGTFHPGMLNPGLDARDRWRNRDGASVLPPKPALFDVHLGAPMGYAEYVGDEALERVEEGEQQESVAKGAAGDADEWMQINPISGALAQSSHPASPAGAAIPLPPAQQRRLGWLRSTLADLDPREDLRLFWRAHRQSPGELPSAGLQMAQVTPGAIPATTSTSTNSSASTSTSAPARTAPASAPEPILPGSTLGLTVLIAMPSPSASAWNPAHSHMHVRGALDPPRLHRRADSSDTIEREKGKQRASLPSVDEEEAEGVPDVVFGVTQVRVRVPPRAGAPASMADGEMV